MSLDRTKVLETAQKFLAKGQHDKAIAEYLKLVKEDPQDVRTWLKIGDLHTRIGAKKDAVETYNKVAQTYAKQGFFLKAVAVYKQILKLAPDELDVSLRLGEMYEQLALVSDALQTYEQVAGLYAKAGDTEKMLSTLRRMVDLDAQNIPARIKYAESLSKAGKTKEAAEAFQAGAQLLKDAGRIDDYLKVAERLLFHRPEDAKLAKELAEFYLQRSDAKRALTKLQICFKADPKDVTTLDLLAKAFIELQQLPKAISVYKEIAKIHQEANKPEDRAKTLKRILELDPGDQEARQAMAAFAQSAPTATRPQVAQAAPPSSAVVEPKTGARPAPAPTPSAPPVDDDDLMIVEESQPFDRAEVPAASKRAEPAPAPERAKRATSIPPEVALEAQVARLLTECDVFSRYGLKQKVLEQLQKVLELAPTHLEARRRLKDAYLEAGRYEEAAHQLGQLADLVLDDDPDRAVEYLRDALQHLPGDEELEGKLELLTGERVTKERDQPPQAVTLEDGDSLDETAPPDDAVVFVDSQRPPPAEVLAAPAPSLPEPPQVSRPAPVSPALAGLSVDEDEYTEAGGLRLESDLPPAQPPRAAAPAPYVPPAPRAPTQPLIPNPPAPRPAFAPPRPAEPAPRVTLKHAEAHTIEESLGPATVFEHRVTEEERAGRDRVESIQPELLEGDDLLEPMSPEEFEAAPLRPSQPGAYRPSRAPGVTIDIEEVLDEADFFVAQGLFDEARSTLNDALSKVPGHPLVLDKLAEVEETAQAAHASQQPSIAPEDDESFQLAEKLAEELGPSEATQAGSDVLDVETVFEQFKKGVAEQIGLEDSDTHFDLGIAYKEMGLLDDAIHEFDLARSNPQRETIAFTMMGLCYVEKGSIAEAISHFKKGLYSDNKTEREELGLYYELGSAYEMLNDPKEALYYFQKVQKRDGTFRGVVDRIKTLTSPKPVKPAAPAGGAVEDVDRAFDDLMGDD